MTLDIESGFESILNVVDQEIDNLVLLYGHSESNKWQALAFQINQINRRTQSIENQILPTLSPGGSLDAGYFGENGHMRDVSNPGDPITRIETNFDETIIEYGFAVSPANVKVWAENPGGSSITGLQGERLRGLGPGDNSAFVWSQWTQTNDGLPTTALSSNPWQGILRIDSSDQGRNNIYIGLENLDENSAPLSVFAMGIMYRVTQIQDDKTVKAMLFGDGYKRRVLTWGGIGNDSPKLPSDWADSLIVTDTDVRKAIKQGGVAR